jgi:cyclic pyranopterin phosphate synthase
MEIKPVNTVSALNDRYNRHINYLRVSVTDRCNLNCIYCRPAGTMPKFSHDDILRYEEQVRIIRIFSQLGLSKIRITGGEPLVRKGLIGFLGQVSSIPGITDFSLTTNGVLLSQHLDDIKACGIRRLNISLDTLDREKFKKITGHDRVDLVWNAILQAHAMGFYPIKINVVALRGINEDEITKLAELTFSFPFHVRFIEQMPIGNASLDARKPLLADDLRAILSGLGPMVPLNNSKFDGPAKRYKIEKALGEIGIISPISHHFCETCNRLRLTANGRLRPCLLSDYSEDLKGPLRAGCSDEDLIAVIFRCLKNKPSNHRILSGNRGTVLSQMSSIGG